MKVNSQHFRTIWPGPRCKFVEIIDQTQLPFVFSICRINSAEKMMAAISNMQIRGAPLIGVAAAYGMALAMLEDDSDTHLNAAAKLLIESRPTAVNLAWAVNRVSDTLMILPQSQRNLASWRLAAEIAEEDVVQNQKIGQYGLELIKQLSLQKQQKTINILTHCNAGWLATVDIGTALAPIYTAHDAGIDVHVWVDETRPRNQGASLTAWELLQHGVPHTVITDNAGGHLMQQGVVDLVIVGADRVTAQGDVCNKIGTYLKALAANDNQIPFYAAVPSPTVDWGIKLDAIAIEHRHPDELRYITGLTATGLQKVQVMPEGSAVLNPAFDITPARLVTGIITERGIYSPAELYRLKDI